MIRQVAFAVALCVMMAGVRAQAEDSPKAVAIAFFKAVENGDLATAKRLANGTEKQLAALDTLVPMIHGFSQLESASLKKWGEEGRKEITQAAPNGIVDMAAKANDSREEINGNSATLTPKEPKADDKEPMKLLKVDGKWKVELTSLPADGLDDPKAREILKKVGEAASNVAAEIEQGKHADVKSAKAALDQKILAALGVAGVPPEPKK